MKSDDLRPVILAKLEAFSSYAAFLGGSENPPPTSKMGDIIRSIGDYQALVIPCQRAALSLG
jgi:hypothetical protein